MKLESRSLALNVIGGSDRSCYLFFFPLAAVAQMCRATHAARLVGRGRI